MTIDQFPNYGKWVEVIALRDQGVLLVCIAVLFVAAWLIVGRFAIPRLLPLFRWGVLLGFYLTLCLLVIGLAI